MRRRIAAAMLALAIASTTAMVQPAAAQGGGCQAFGQHVAELATTLGRDFGQTASSNAPLNGVVEAEQNQFCG